MKNKNYHIEVWRIIATALIVRHHTYYVGITEYKLKLSWIYVEFFFILTGFFTAAHFAHHPVQESLDEKAAYSIRYTFHKFSRFAPYFMPAIAIQYVLRYLLDGTFTLEAFLKLFSSLPMEALLLSSSQGPAVLGPLWFLSAMFIVFPLLSLLISCVPNKVLCICGSIYALLYYGIVGVIGERRVPHDVLRAFAALLIGVIVYNLITEIRISQLNSFLLLIAGNLCMLFTVWMCYLNASYTTRTILLAFVFAVAFLLSSDYPYPESLKGITDRIAKYCIPIFLYQRIAASSVLLWFHGLPSRKRMLIYYLLCIIYAFVSVQIVSLLSRKRKHHKGRCTGCDYQ